MAVDAVVWPGRCENGALCVAGAGRFTRTSLAKDRAKELRAAVEHLGLIGEIVGAVDEAHHLHDALDPVEVAQLVLERRDR